MNQSGGITLPREITMSHQDQAYELIQTVKCRLAPSAIHGIGVFAIRDILKGDLVYCALTQKPEWYYIPLVKLQKLIGDTHPEIYELIVGRWPQVANGAHFLSPNYDARLISFMNHSDTPNYDPVTDRALADIKAGEEVTESYLTVHNYELVYPWLKDKDDAI